MSVSPHPFPGDNMSTGQKRKNRHEVEVDEDLTSSQRRRVKMPTPVTLGRGICKVVSLFDTIPTLVEAAERQVDADEEDDDNDGSVGVSAQTAEGSEDQRRREKRECASYRELVRIIPGFEATILKSSSREIAWYYESLLHGAHEARSDDISTMKKFVAQTLNEEMKTRGWDPKEFLDPDDRRDRGFHHRLTGELLCPIDFDWSDSEIRALVCRGEEHHHPSSSLYARCFYPPGVGDPDDLVKGFLRSALLVKAYACIFTSPSSVKNIRDDFDNNVHLLPPIMANPSIRKSTKSSVASKLGLRQVTPRSIAYVAVLLHFSLTDAPSWKKEYNGFSYPALYDAIVDFFEDLTGPLAKRDISDLLAWWNAQIFPAPAISSSLMMASMKRMRAQLVAREARAAQADGSWV